jgi:hypothetical protein
MTDAAGSESWARQVDTSNSRSIHKDQRTANSVTKSATYFLDLAGNTTQVVYPTSTGRTVKYNYNAANRPITASDVSNGITYATDFQTLPSGSTCLSGAVCYTPQGTFYALSIGQSSAFTGLNVKHTYNSRLQPSEFSASSSASNAIDISYNYVDPVTTKNGGAYEIKYLPDTLKIIQRGTKPGHFEIVPREPGLLTPARFIEFLRKIITEGPKE